MPIWPRLNFNCSFQEREGGLCQQSHSPSWFSLLAWVVTHQRQPDRRRHFQHVSGDLPTLIYPKLCTHSHIRQLHIPVHKGRFDVLGDQKLLIQFQARSDYTTVTLSYVGSSWRKSKLAKVDEQSTYAYAMNMLIDYPLRPSSRQMDWATCIILVWIRFSARITHQQHEQLLVYRSSPPDAAIDFPIRVRRPATI